MNNVDYVLNYIYLKSPFQKKKIESFIDMRDSNFNQEFNNFLELYIGYLENNQLTIEYGIDAYLKMISDMFRCQVKFMKTGKYPISKTQEAFL